MTDAASDQPEHEQHDPDEHEQHEQHEHDQHDREQHEHDQHDHEQRARSRRSVGRRDVTEWRSRAGKRLADRHATLAGHIGPHAALVVSLAIGGTVAAVSAFGAARIYDGVTGRDGLESLDGPALALAKRLRSPALDGLAAGIARVFGPVGMPLVALAGAGMLVARDRHATPLTLVSAAGIGSLAMTLAGKDIIHRNRPHKHDAIPPYETSPSFPSGHTLNATTVAGTLAYLLILDRTRQAPQLAIAGGAAATAVAVGLSRVLLGAHWFTDVAVGWTTGTGWVALVVTSHRLYLTAAQD